MASPAPPGFCTREGRETLGFVWSDHSGTIARYTTLARGRDHLCLAMVDGFGGGDKVAVLPGLSDLSAVHCLA